MFVDTIYLSEDEGGDTNSFSQTQSDTRLEQTT